MLLRVTGSAFNDRGPLFMEQTLSAIHQGMRDGESFTLLLMRDGPTVGPACEASPALERLMTSQLLAYYPSARVEPLREVADGHPVWTAELSLHPELFPLKRHPQFNDASMNAAADPLAGIFAALAGGERDPLRTRVELVARAASPRRVHRLHEVFRNLQRPGLAEKTPRERYLNWALSLRRHLRLLAWCYARRAGRIGTDDGEALPTNRTHDRESAFQAAHDKLQRRLFEVRLRLSVRAPAEQEERALAKLRELAGALGAFCEPDRATWRLASLGRGPMRQQRREGFLLSAEELATLWHLPVLSIDVPTLDISTYRQLEPPVGLPDPKREAGLVTIGKTKFRDHHRLFGIRPDDRRRHLYVVGEDRDGKKYAAIEHADRRRLGRARLLSDRSTRRSGRSALDPDSVPPHQRRDLV
jgi:hypothetical protein